MYKLYWMLRSGAMLPEAVLEELGAAYQRIEFDRQSGAYAKADYLAINPMGKIPALLVPESADLPGGAVLTETGAMVQWLCDRHPEAGLIPAAGSAERLRHDRWLFFMAVNLYMTDLRSTYPERYSVDPEAAPGIRTAARRDWDGQFAILDRELGDGPFLLGARFSAADIYLATMAVWHYNSAALFAACPNLKRSYDAVLQRPAVAKVLDEHYGPL